MKTMTCKQLGGACDKKFHAGTFEDMAALSKKHGQDMIKQGDAAHLKAMREMMDLMQSAEEFSEWMEKKRRQFEALPDDPEV